MKRAKMGVFSVGFTRKLWGLSPKPTLCMCLSFCWRRRFVAIDLYFDISGGKLE